MSPVERAAPAGPSASDYLLDINKVLLAMADSELLLNSQELSGSNYEDFSTQEDTLRVGEPAYFVHQQIAYLIISNLLIIMHYTYYTLRLYTTL